MSSLERFAAAKLAGLEAKCERRRLVPTARADGPYLIRGGKRYVSFSCNDYLNLATHPVVVEAAMAALQEHGTGAGSSRLITGNHPLYVALESRLARFKDTEDAIVFGSGYLANIGIIPALAGPGDLVLIDVLAHACLGAGARLSGATEIRFPHNDMAALRAILARERDGHRHSLILTDGVFSMDGDLAPLPELAALAGEFDAWLMVDDAHGLGVVGGGRGSAFAFGPDKVPVPLQMGTLSKSIGGYGGYLCASAKVVSLLHSRARSFVYATGLPPATLAGAIAALDFIAANPDYVARPLANARTFTALLNLPEAQSAVVPVILGASEVALKASAALEAQGFIVTAIRPPTVPAGTARLRVTFTAQHRDDDVQALADAIQRLGLGHAMPCARSS